MSFPLWFSSCERNFTINKKWMCVSCYCNETRGQTSCMYSLASSSVYSPVTESLFSLAAYKSDYRWQRPIGLDQHFQDIPKEKKKKPEKQTKQKKAKGRNADVTRDSEIKGVIYLICHYVFGKKVNSTSQSRFIDPAKGYVRCMHRAWMDGIWMNSVWRSCKRDGGVCVGAPPSAWLYYAHWKHLLKQKGMHIHGHPLLCVTSCPNVWFSPSKI